jgi:hypothetical protein
VSTSGDDWDEMPRSRPFDDGEIDALLSGSVPSEDLASLSAFIIDVRSASEVVPTPSPALAAALAAGFSTEQGDLPATAASNVHGPARRVAGLPKWRKARMKVQMFLASLGVAGKVALGTSVAFAATTGAGAAGMLPAPVQSAMSSAVKTATPFSMPDGKSHSKPHDKVAAPPKTTTTTKPKPTTTTTKPKVDKPVVTPTTVKEPTTPTTIEKKPVWTPPVTEPKQWPPVTEPKDTTPTTKPTTPTTKKPYVEVDPIVLECTPSTDGVTSQVSCEWSAVDNAAHKKYVLYRMDGMTLLQSADALTFVDTTVLPGQSYSYKVKSYDVYGNVVTRSDIIDVGCC